MHRPDHFVRIGHIFAQIANQPTKLVGRGVADGVGHVNRGRPRLNHLGQHLHQKLGVAPPRILGRKFHIVAQGAGKAHGRGGLLNTLLPVNLQLILQVDVAGGQKGVDAVAGSRLYRIIRPLNVHFAGPRQARDDHWLARFTAVGQRPHLFGNAPHRLKIAGGSDGEPRLANIHPKA